MSEQREYEAAEEVMRTIASRLQATAEAHLEACIDAEDAWEFRDQDDEDAEWPHSPASAPFCGCTTCIVREVLDVSWPLVEEYVDARLRIAQTERSDA